MKKKLFALVSFFALGLPVFAAFYMCVKLNDGDILKFDVEEVERVIYEKLGDTSDSTATNMRITMNGDSVIKYNVKNVAEVFYEKYINPSDTTITDTTGVEPIITDTIPVDTMDIAASPLQFSVLSDSTVLLSGCDKSFFIDEDGVITERELVIPAKVQIDSKVYTVTGIGNSVFSMNGGLTGILLPSTITTIGDSAFYACIGLEDFIIPSNVAYIGEEAFQGCTKLTEIKIPSSVTTIKEWAFYGCERLEILIDNAEDRIEIGKDAFKWCKAVTFTKENTPKQDTTFTFRILSDSTVEIVRDSAKLASETVVIIPDKTIINNKSYDVVSIGDSVFYNMSNLKTIVIPSSIYSIGNEAFAYCNGLKNIGIPEKVTNIGERAFYGCDSLISLIIPASLDSIGHSAFANCGALARLTILPGVTIIGKEAFAYCSSLSSVDLPETVVEIDDEAFMQCTRLTEVNIPSSVTRVGARAFYGCNNLNVVIDNSRDKVSTEAQAFDGCKSIRYTGEDSSVVDTSATPLKFYRLSNSTLEVIYDDSYRDILADSVVIPSFVSMGDSVFAVTATDSRAFINCTKIKTIEIPASITTIGDSALGGCKSLTEILVAAENPNYTAENNILYNKDKTSLICAGGGISGEVKIDTSVTVIKYKAFYFCDSLRKVTIPENVTKIEEWAFYGCDNLDVVVENSEYEMEVGYNAFGRCKSVVFTKDDPSVINDTDTPIKFNILSDSTVEVGKCLKHEIFGAIVVPEKVRINKKVYTVVSISNSAFENCNLMTSLELPETIISIGDNAFNFCSGMAKVNIPASVTTIGEMAFADCTNLTSLEISENIKSIGVQAFAYCSKLSIKINTKKEDVKIGDNAFFGIKAVKYGM